MKEQNEEFKKGYPDKRGLYRCLVDGQVRHLVHHKCDITGRHWWTDTAGYDVVGFEVKYGDQETI